MTSLRINIDASNIISAEIHDTDGEILEYVYLGNTYTNFLRECEELVLNYGCDAIDTIWMDEFIDILETFSDEGSHPNIWELANG